MKKIPVVDFSIKDFRKEKGISQKKLAEKIGYDRTSLSNWENGKSVPPLIVVSLIKFVLREGC